MQLVLSLVVALWGFPELSNKAPLWQWKQDDLPLSVLIDADMEDWRAEVAEATAWWNKKLNRQIFLPLDELGVGGIVVVMPYLIDDKMVGYASKDKRNAAVHLWPTYHGNRQRAVRHELGHILGLRHSTKITSVMWYQVEDGDYDLLDEERAKLLEFLP